MLGIGQWDVAELVRALGRLKGTLGQWMGDKNGKWHQVLYIILMHYTNAAPKYTHEVIERKATITSLCLVRCADGIYRKGSDCFFSSDGVEPDNQFPRVSKGVYFVDREENKKVREFLEAPGVREMDEKAEIEYILKERYSQEAIDQKRFRPELRDMQKFIAFAEKHPNGGDMKELFRGQAIFKLESGKWGKPQIVYIDMPFMDTGLREWFAAQGDTKKKSALSGEYETCGSKPYKIGEFAKNLTYIQYYLLKKPMFHQATMNVTI